MNRPDPTIVRDLVADVDVDAIRSTIDDLVAEVDFGDAADRARHFVDDGTEVLARGSGRVVEVVAGTIVPGTLRIVRRHPRPIVATLLAVLAVAAVWTWWSRRPADDAAAVTSLDRAA